MGFMVPMIKTSVKVEPGFGARALFNPHPVAVAAVVGALVNPRQAGILDAVVEAAIFNPDPIANFALIRIAAFVEPAGLLCTDAPRLVR